MGVESLVRMLKGFDQRAQAKLVTWTIQHGIFEAVSRKAHFVERLSEASGLVTTALLLACLQRSLVFVGFFYSSLTFYLALLTQLWFHSQKSRLRGGLWAKASNAIVVAVTTIGLCHVMCIVGIRSTCEATHYCSAP